MCQEVYEMLERTNKTLEAEIFIQQFFKLFRSYQKFEIQNMTEIVNKALLVFPKSEKALNIKDKLEKWVYWNKAIEDKSPETEQDRWSVYLGNKVIDLGNQNHIKNANHKEEFGLEIVIEKTRNILNYRISLGFFKGSVSHGK